MGTVSITSDDFSIDQVVDSIETSRTGGIVTFTGIVREGEGERRTVSMRIETYQEMALTELESLRERAIREFSLEDMTVVHRIGVLSPGENILIIAAAGQHRSECFDAARFVIDEIKRTVPIWKKEISPEGERWAEGEH